jgi:TetR/AcrR family transcriptional regulator
MESMEIPKNMKKQWKKTMKKRTKSVSSDIAVRERLLSCATQLLTRKGYTATTVREIVDAAGVTKPVLYYYFQNKEGIYLELIRGTFTKFEALLDVSLNEQGSTTEKLLRLCDQMFSLFMENMEVARLMYSIYYGPPQGAPFFDFDSYHLKFHDAIKRLVKRGIRQAEFQKGNAEDMMWTIIGAVTVVMEGQLCHPEMGIDRRRLLRILKFIFRGISTQSANREEKLK